MAITQVETKQAGTANRTTFIDTYQEVTDAVIKALEEGTVIWQCSWNETGFPKNITTGNQYRGWNSIWLNFHSIIKGYQAPFYLTYKQAQALGGTIKKGEKGTRITYWATIQLKNQTTETTDRTTGETTETHPTKMVPKSYTVFNIEQTEGINFPAIEALDRTDAEKIASCQLVVHQMPARPVIKNGTEAFYTPSTDTVIVPTLQRSKTSEGYYSTLFHELAHSTGHESRLNRKEVMQSDGFGKTNYAKEELTAEMTAAFLNAITGISSATLPNNAAYIKNWLTVLKNDKTLILKAAGQAQKAADYILNVQYEAVMTE